ncbi:MAG: hypothetical protein L0Z73_11665 [Gammaproteobacteria bacterium]|nr:hypothetical protein [Gammaproteobacteria bacterium]
MNTAFLKNTFIKPVTLLLILIFLPPSNVYADRDDRGRDHDDRRDKPENAHPDYREDKRFQLNRSYPRPGYVVRTLPERRHVIHYRDRDYFYIGGVWYHPSGPNFVVIRPPVGIVVPILPPFYATVWFRGIPYYYANDVYYMWRPDLNAYQVATPPIAENEPEPPLIAEELFIYPKEGQSEQKQAEDRYACHRWGVDQAGYDPTQPPGNLSVTELSRKRDDYQRAM